MSNNTRGLTTIAHVNSNITILSTICPIKIELAMRKIEVPHLPVYQFLERQSDGVTLLAVPTYTHLISHKSVSEIRRIARSMYLRKHETVAASFARYVERSILPESEKFALRTLCDVVIEIESQYNDPFLLDLDLANFMMNDRSIIYNDIFNMF